MMTELIGVAAVAVVAWFAAGTIWNIHAGRELLRWMQGGLPLLGERTTVRWLGSTAVEMAIRDGKAPFSGATLVIFLEPRDMPWMWALGRSRGRRDTLIIRGVLRRPPAVELEALDPASWSGRDALPRVPRDWPVRQSAAPGDLVVHRGCCRTPPQADALLTCCAPGCKSNDCPRDAPSRISRSTSPSRIASSLRATSSRPYVPSLNACWPDTIRSPYATGGAAGAGAACFAR
jgi:hypothetical protein